MKIKMDFVTNSSSTSFCLWGRAFDYNDLKKVVEEIDDMYDVCAREGLEYISDGDDNVYIGMSPDKMDDDETLREFKKKVHDRIFAVGLGIGEIQLHAGEFYNY